MTEAEQQLFLLNAERLHRAVTECLGGLLPTSVLFSALDEFNPGLDGPGKMAFLLNLRVLGRYAAKEETEAVDVNAVAEEVLELLLHGKITATNDDAIGFLTDLRPMIETLVVSLRQIVENTGGAAPSTKT